ncbi:MAG: hypothetical protein U1F47_13315 [Hyphomicrobiales bacterium]
MTDIILTTRTDLKAAYSWKGAAALAQRLQSLSRGLTRLSDAYRQALAMVYVDPYAHRRDDQRYDLPENF